MSDSPNNGQSEYAKGTVFAGNKWKMEDIYQWEHGVAVEPWPEPVNGKALLDELEAYVGRFVVLAKWVAQALALWIVHTYAFPLRDITTYVGIESPEKRCGKTTLLTVLCDLVNRPVVASNISSPAFYRVIEEKSPTLLIDEADTVLHRNRELRGILNSGYTRQTAYVIRADNRPRSSKGRLPVISNQCSVNSGEEKKAVIGNQCSVNGEAEKKAVISNQGSGNGGNGGEGESSNQNSLSRESELACFSCWCPKAIATIRHLPDTLADRCIVVSMQRKTWRENCERLRKLDGTDLRRKCARFVQDRAEEIRKAEPSFPNDLNDRACDIWEPLFAVADLAGGDWPAKARNAALGLTAIAQEESPIASLLLDVMVAFSVAETEQKQAGIVAPKEGGTRVFSRDIVSWLNSATDRPWSVMRNGKEITELWLAQMLRPYGIKPKTIWIGEQAAKGYVHDEFAEVFRRYVSKAAAAAYVEELSATRVKREVKEDNKGPADSGSP